MTPKILMAMACVALLTTATGCGGESLVAQVRPATNAQAEPTATEAVVHQYALTKLDAFVRGDRTALAALPAHEAQRLNERLDRHAHQREPVLDAGLALQVRATEPAEGGAVRVIYTEGISLGTDIDGTHHYSYGEEYHSVLVRDGRVVEDNFIDIDAPDFERVRQLPETSPLHTLRTLPGDPYRPADAFQPAQVPIQVGPTGRSVAAINGSSLQTYARSYCNSSSRNTAYPYYGNTATAGGDCTNFVSQCLEAGSLPFVDRSCAGRTGSSLTTCQQQRKEWATYWWSNRSNRFDHSFTWSIADSSRRHFEERLGPAASTVHWTWENAHVGDVVYMDFQNDGHWDHACVVTTAERRWWGGFNLRVSCHTNDHCDDDFYSIAGNRGWSIQIVHMP